jgi:Icc protein
MLLAQLSDPHVRPKGVRYQDVVDCNALLVQAIDHVVGMDRRPDLVDTPRSTPHFGRFLVGLPIPYLVIPGNHDDGENLRKAFSDHEYLPRRGPLHYCVDDHPVRIIALDSTVPGMHHGHIDAEGLDWLAGTLARDGNKPTLLMLHHPPFVCGIPYMDQYRYFEEAQLRAVIERFDNVEMVLCGHVH